MPKIEEHAKKIAEAEERRRTCTGFIHKLGNKIQWFFHDFFMTNLNFPWLRNAENPTFWGHIFARWLGEFFQFSNTTKSLD